MSDDEYASAGDAIFARSLKARREANGLSQRAMAAVLSERGVNFNFTTIGRIERGDRRVTVGEAAVLAEVLNTTVVQLLDSHSDLTRAHETRSRALRELEDRANIYQASVLDLAVIADAAEGLTDSDLDWLNTELEAHTPARIAAMYYLGAESAVRNSGNDPSTPYVARLLRQLEADYRALKRIREDG